MKKLFFALILTPCLVLSALTPQVRAQDTVKVFCWSLTPQAEAVMRGLERVLGQSLPVSAAGGDYAQGEMLVRQLAGEKLRLLIVLGTPALALTAPRIKKTPVLFAMVADPYQTGAAYDKSRPDDHQENITGIASPPPLAEAIRQTQKFFPAKRHWGLLYDLAEGPSVELKQIFAALASESGLKLTALAAAPGTGGTVELAALDRQGVQVVFLPPDKFSRHYASALLALGQQRRLIVVNGNPGLVGRGAVLSITLDYEAVGELAGRLAQRLLAGEKPRNLAIQQASPAAVEVNESLLSLWAGYPPEK